MYHTPYSGRRRIKVIVVWEIGRTFEVKESFESTQRWMAEALVTSALMIIVRCEKS
jgi:hypothetical protein